MQDKTKKTGLIGHPISHSISPAMHNNTFAALGLDFHYSLLPTKAEDLQATLSKLTEQSFVGGNVTMPHKQAVMAYLDEISDDARIIGAVNTLHLQDGKLKGYNADWRGFLNALTEEGHDPVGMRVLLLGAGGAARSAVYALAQAGVAQLTVVNRTEARGEAVVAEMAHAFPNCPITFQPLERETFAGFAQGVDLVVNTTSVGMEPHEGHSVWPDDLPLPNAIFYDVIYKPAQTRFLQRAQAEGLPTLNGLGMVVHQGVVGFELWTGQKPPVELLRQAALETLYGSET